MHEQGVVITSSGIPLSQIFVLRVCMHLKSVFAEIPPFAAGDRILTPRRRKKYTPLMAGENFNKGGGGGEVTLRVV